MVDGHCSSSKSINSCVPQDSILSPTLFLFSINDLLNLTQCPILSYAEDSIFHFPTSFSRRPNQKHVNDSCGDATERLTSDLSLISDRGRENLVLFNAPVTPLFHLSTRQNLPDNYYTLYLNDTHLSPFSTLTILGLSFTKSLNWKFHIFFLAKSPSKKLGNLLLTLYMGLILYGVRILYGT